MRSFASAAAPLARRTLLALGGSALASLYVRPVYATGKSQFWPGGKRGAVSLSYDDGLESQLDHAIPQLDAAGMKGTFFVTADQIETRLGDWREAAAEGHELANHTVSHPCDLQLYRPARFMAREVAPVEHLLDGIEGPARAKLYAYPCDVTNLGAGTPNEQARRYEKLLAGQGIIAARTSEGEPNKPATVLRRLYRLQALALGYDAPDLASITAYLDSAVRHGFWAILVIHEVRPETRGQGDTSTAEHQAVLEAIAARDLYCAPIGAVLSHILAGAHAG